MAVPNKMFIMLPVMFLARKLDGEDPNIVFLLRVVYGVVQVICGIVVIYTYYKATQVKSMQMIYVPPPAMPFGVDADAKKKYTQVPFATHVLSQARSMLGSTAFGIVMTVGLHLYKGMIVSLAIQSIMGPFGLFDSALVKAVFTSQHGLTPEAKLFDEKTLVELTDNDEVIDQQGNVVPMTRTAVKKAHAKDKVEESKAKQKTVEELMLDTWDAGVNADLAALMAELDRKNCNTQTKEDRWTPLMVLAGLGATGAPMAIRQLRKLGADTSIVDVEGWTALHWAAFHGQTETARELANETKLLAVKDKEGNTPIDMARKEGNEKVAEIYEKALGENKKSK
ncbi:hypothetical protein MPSEU_000359100 [Mayamaea pseudoterrestris]|nr:hypothetical protein MPSEU_000359100 [Mayamaea pseudoterrestris]